MLPMCRVRNCIGTLRFVPAQAVGSSALHCRLVPVAFLLGLFILTSAVYFEPKWLPFRVVGTWIYGEVFSSSCDFRCICALGWDLGFGAAWSMAI